MEHRTARARLTEVVSELTTAHEFILHTAAGLACQHPPSPHVCRTNRVLTRHRVAIIGALGWPTSWAAGL
jgi:hypothetical protein